MKIYRSKKLCSWSVLNVQVVFAVTYSSGGLHLAVNSISSGFSIVFSAVCLAQQAMKSVLRAFFFFWIQMQFHVEIAFLIWLLFWFWIFKLILTWQTLLCLGIGGRTCFSVVEAQLESTYLVAVCEVSRSDSECAQHKGSSGNSCLQFETLLPALGLCWLTLCPARRFCLLWKIQWNNTVNQMQCHHWNKIKN